MLQREGLKRKEMIKYVKDVILQVFLMWTVISLCVIRITPNMYYSTEGIVNNHLGMNATKMLG